MENNSSNINKKIFENLENQTGGFEEESEAFSGDDINVN
jgi:hypothetical protein